VLNPPTSVHLELLLAKPRDWQLSLTPRFSGGKGRVEGSITAASAVSDLGITQNPVKKVLKQFVVTGVLSTPL